MKYDFEPGEKIRMKGGTIELYFVAQFGDTMYATVREPGRAENASAYTCREWERAPKPFFEADKAYRFASSTYEYHVHHVFEMEGKRYAAGISGGGSEFIFGEDDFRDMEEA